MNGNCEKEINATEDARPTYEDTASLADEALDVLSNSLSLRMPKAVLYETLRCLKIEKKEPDGDLLRSLDNLWYEISSRPSSIAIYEVFSENGELIATLNDLYQKAEYTNRYKKQPPLLTLCDIARIASLYLSMIGAAPSEDVGFENNGDEFKMLSFTSDKKTVASLFLDLTKPLPYGYAKKKQTLGRTPIQNEIYSPAKKRTEENFLRRIQDRHTLVSPVLTPERFAPSAYGELNVSFSDETRACEKFRAFATDGYTLSAHFCQTCSFTDGINIALDSLFALLAKGIDRRNVNFAFKYSVDTGNVAPSLAAMLGVYRVMIELCIPDCEAQIERSDGAAVFCAAYTRCDPKEALSDSLGANSEKNKVYMLSFPRLTDSSPALMPDFDALRNMCQCLHSLISDKTAICVRAFNGSLSKAVREMCREEYDVDTSECSDFENVRAQGFIIEVRPTVNIPFAKLVGTLKRKDKETRDQILQSTDGN